MVKLERINRIRVNSWIKNPELARKLAELKQAGLVRSNADLIAQGIRLLYERLLDERLKTTRTGPEALSKRATVEAP